jgi:hypothetical protein
MISAREGRQMFLQRVPKTVESGVAFAHACLYNTHFERFGAFRTYCKMTLRGLNLSYIVLESLVPGALTGL